MGQTPSQPISKPTMDVKFKVIVVGDSGVGKTHLIQQLVNPQKTNNLVMTVGVDVFIRKVTIGDRNFTLQIWDTAGCERFRALSQRYYRDADAVIFVYDITRSKSFDSLKFWFGEVKTYCYEELPIFLVGNKLDLEDLREVPTDLGKNLAKSKRIEFLEVSATKNDKVEELFTNIVAELWDQKRAKLIGDGHIPNSDGSFSVVITDSTPQVKPCPCA